MNKKPNVVAKTARKVKLSRSEVDMAKNMAVSLEQVAKDKLPKRGRPKGSKNKPTPFNNVPFPIDWEGLAKRLQTALATEMKANEDLNFLLNRKRTFVERLRCLFTGIA